MEKVPPELDTVRYRDYPRCPEWFSDYLVELQEKLGTHVLKVVQDDGEVILVRYVPDRYEERLEYARKGKIWTEVGPNFFSHVIDERDDFEFVEGKSEAVVKEFGEIFKFKIKN
jgi:hypothetical protein